ncbi:hypothetical protein ACFZAO_05665 [Streptomyces griseoaurantiacus]|uniref:hypothetical protein n=1 Tax=Streptomyces griseoaurantiacus TaxID=68213 RepID=UPI0036E3F67A
MKLRSEVIAALQAGEAVASIARRLHVDAHAVRHTRNSLGIPPTVSGRPAADSVEELFHRYTQPADDGHAQWTGPLQNGYPRLTYQGHGYSARQLAFRIHHGRDPIGRYGPDCGRHACVEPAHMADRIVRERNQRADTAYAAIFPEAAA